MFSAAHRIQEPGDLLRARHNGEFLRLPAGWDIIFDNPKPFESDFVQEPEYCHGDRNRAGRQSPLLNQVKLPRPDLGLAQSFRRLAKMAGEPRNLLDVGSLRMRREITGSACPRSYGGEVGSLPTPLRNEQRHMAPPHRLAVELSGQRKHRMVITHRPVESEDGCPAHATPA